MPTTVRHMGFELEQAHAAICRALVSLPEKDADAVLEYIGPVRLQRAVKDTLDTARERARTSAESQHRQSR